MLAIVGSKHVSRWSLAVALVAAFVLVRPAFALEPSAPLALPVSGCAAWTTLAPASAPGDLSRIVAGMILDQPRDRLVVFGGVAAGSFQPDPRVLAFDLSGTQRWSVIETTGGGPGRRLAPTVVYDPDRDRMLVFGGLDSMNVATADLWALDLATGAWSLIEPDGTPPGARYYARAVVDPVSQRMIMFGGANSSFQAVNDTYELTLTGPPTWSVMGPAGTPPPARVGHSFVLDPTRNQVVLFGGGDPAAPGGELQDVWALDLAGGGTWTELTPTGTLPPRRSDHVAVMDVPRDRMVVFGGSVADTATATAGNDVWALSLTGTIEWTPILPTGDYHPPVVGHAAVYDVMREHLVSVGSYPGQPSNDVWTMNLPGTPPGWTRVVASGVTPDGRSGHVVALDQPRRRLLLHGGVAGFTTYGDTWSFDLVDSTWTLLQATGPAPVVSYHAAVIDSLGERLIVFGGSSGTIPVNDVWALSLNDPPVWSHLTPAGLPPAPRQGASAIYDPGRNRIVVFGGYDLSGDRADVWALSLAGGGTWTELLPTGGPLPFVHGEHSAVYDVLRDRMIVVGRGFPHDELESWQLDFGTVAWSDLLNLNGTPWEHRPAAMIDPLQDRLLVLGRGLFALPLAGPPQWTTIDTEASDPANFEQPRAGVAAAFDPASNSILTFSGDSVDVGDPRNALRAVVFPSNVYPLNITLQPEVGGTVQSSSFYSCISGGTNVELTAVPAPGFVFSHWDGNVTGTVNPIQFTINGRTEVVAYFTQPAPTCAGWRLVADQTGQLPLNLPTLAYDPPRRRALAVGTNVLNETAVWELSLDAGADADWYTVTTVGTSPGLWVEPRIVYDPVRDRLVLFGGHIGSSLSADVWTLELSGTPTWAALVTSGTPPSPRVLSSMVYDPGRDRLVVFGGRTDYADSTSVVNETWSLTLGATPTWTLESTTGGPPAGRDGHAAVFDAAGDSMIVFGGFTATGPQQDVWVLTGGSQWSKMLPAGAPPSPRGSASAVLDDARQRMIVFGGTGKDISLGAPYDTSSGEVFALALRDSGAWLPLETDGSPPLGRMLAGGIFDPDLDRLTIANGYGPDTTSFNSSLTQLNDTYQLSFAGGEWLGLAARPAVGGTVTHTLGPQSCIPSGTPLEVTATPASGYTFVGWEGDASGTDNPLSVTMTSTRTIVARFVETITATVMSRFEALVVDGGIEVRWQFADPEQVAKVELERAEQVAGPWTAVPAEFRSDGELFRATDASIEAGHAYWYRLGTTFTDGTAATFGPVSAHAAGIAASDLDFIAPNPGRLPLRIGFVLARPGRATLRLYDVAGRQVAVLDDGVRQPGRHSVTWTGAGHARLAAGLYIMRLVAPDRVVTRRVAIVP